MSPINPDPMGGIDRILYHTECVMESIKRFNRTWRSKMFSHCRVRFICGAKTRWLTEKYQRLKAVAFSPKKLG